MPQLQWQGNFRSRMAKGIQDWQYSSLLGFAGSACMFHICHFSIRVVDGELVALLSIFHLPTPVTHHNHLSSFTKPRLNTPLSTQSITHSFTSPLARYAKEQIYQPHNANSSSNNPNPNQNASINAFPYFSVHKPMQRG